MRTNHIPTVIRLQNRIEKMQIRLFACWSSKKYYPQCKYCRITNVECNIEGDHRVRCPLRGMEKQVTHYKNLQEKAKLETKPTV